MCYCLVILGQIVVFIVNFVVVLLGLLTTGLGLLIKYGADYVASLIPIPIADGVSGMNIVIIAIIVTGVILFLLGITGCIGATCKIIFTLIVNASGFAVLAAGTIYLLVQLIQFLDTSTLSINDMFTNIFNNNATQNGTFQAIESLLECCGVNGTDSYVSAGMPIPPTCCNSTDQIQMMSLYYEDYYVIPDINMNITCHSIGCATVITNYIEKYGSIVKNVFIVIVALEIATIAFDVLIACNKKKK